MNNLDEATLQWLNDLTAQGILTTDADLRIHGWNRWLEIHSGHKAADVIGRSVLEVYPELVTRRIDQWYHHALNGQVMALAQRLHRYLLPMPSAGHYGFARMQQSAQIAPLTAEGQIIGTITIISDVTEREGREREMQRQIAALEALHNVSQGILSLDLPECLQRIVDTTAALVQAPTVAVVLRYDDHLQVEASTRAPDEIDMSRVNLPASLALAVVRSGQPMLVTDLKNTKGLAPLDPRSQCVIAIPLIAESHVIGALIIESPGAETLNADDQRRVMLLATQAAIGIRNAQLYREAQEAIQIRETFMSIASHELKTPLTTILGNTQMLQRRSAREGSLNERDKRTLDIISTQTTRLNRMVAALLDISRIQSGQLSIELTPLDLCILAQRIVDDVQPTLDYHHIMLSLPEEALMIEGDELRLEQVLHNIIQNAVKYSPKGGVIQLQVERRGERACIIIIDEGLGIPADALPRLFSRFYRADNVQSQQISGMGIGLYVVKEIIDLHGGEIDVSSQENVGSTFTICLPLPPQ